MSCSNNNTSSCPDQYGCPSGTCPDFLIRRYDTKPDYRVLMEDCDGPMDLTNLVLESTMWAKAKLKSNILSSDTSLSLADNIGFNQIMVGDVLILERTRGSEKVLVTSFNEDQKTVNIQRAHDGTTAQGWTRGNPIKIVKFINKPIKIEMVYEDVLEIDGTTNENVLQESYFVHEWGSPETDLPGCYYLEFKLMTQTTVAEPWIRRFPVDKEGFLIKITDTFTSES
jgi:hypothetical protein